MVDVPPSDEVIDTMSAGSIVGFAVDDGVGIALSSWRRTHPSNDVVDSVGGGCSSIDVSATAVIALEVVVVVLPPPSIVISAVFIVRSSNTTSSLPPPPPHVGSIPVQRWRWLMVPPPPVARRENDDGPEGIPFASMRIRFRHRDD